ncbi:MAG: acyl carrier protein [Oscillospiraceae bacterium]|nr:acyl carrier protein [Oscillospiraceae bacterium]
MNRDAVMRKILDMTENNEEIKRTITDCDASLSEVYGFDSMLYIYLVVETEKTFGIEFEDINLSLDHIQTMNQFVDVVMAYVGALPAHGAGK